MKKQDFEQLFAVTEQELEALIPLFTKDYSQEAMAFLRNHHRVLHYWGEGVNILPPQEEGTTKRRRFSFFDLVWLGIVRELREYGMEKEKIAILKEELLSPLDHRSLLRTMKEYRKEAEAMMAKSYGVATTVIRALLDEYLQKQEQARVLGFTMLTTYLYYIIGRKQTVKLLVSKEGQHRVAIQSVDGTWLIDEEGPFNTSFIYISLGEIMHFFASQSFVADSVKQTMLSPSEWALIEETRQEGLKSITVHFNNGKMQKLESTRRKKLQLEARLTEVLLKGGYEDLNITTENGRIVYAEQTVKKRFNEEIA